MTLALPAWFEIGSLVVLLLVLAVDLLLVWVRPRIPSVRESLLWVAFYIALALAFAVLVLLVGDADRAGQFLAGWVTEYSLSVDNLFLFVLIMSRFAVPRGLQQRVLLIGILVALVLRGVFIALGAALIANVSWIFYVFGAFLLYAAVAQLRGSSRNPPSFGRRTPRTDTRSRWTSTPLIVVLAALGTTDVLFALDSIPAIFGITQSPFIVFAANVFALMGLRQLYFLLGHLLNRLRFLAHGIAFILFFIGVKLVLHALHTNTVPFLNGGRPVGWAPEIPTAASLVVVLGAMLVATMASLVASRIDGGTAVAPRSGPDEAGTRPAHRDLEDPRI